MIRGTSRIAEARKGKFQQKEMANMLNLSVRQYSRIENYKSIPNIRTAIKIADKLEVENPRELWPPTTGNEQF